MGWNVIFLLHLFCAMAAMAGVHSQGDTTQEDVIHDQAFEGEAVHSMMQSWLQAGTSPDLFDTRWGWYLDEHPCVVNSPSDWYGISCSTRSYQPDNNSLVKYHTLDMMYLTDIRGNIPSNGDYAPPPLVGGLPSAIVKLINLGSLLIANASNLSGPLPAGVLCSGALRKIELINCSFSGSINSGIGPGCDSNLQSEYLDLSQNSFIEMSPLDSSGEYFRYPNLKYLNVSHNQIKGEFVIPAEVLEIIDVSNNLITNITVLESSRLSSTLKSMYAQNISLSRFPIEIFEYQNLQDIYLDLNDISSIAQISSNINVSTIQRIYMSKNKFQEFPMELLKLPNLEEITLDSNNIIGELYLPNISCQYSKIKLISLLDNNITHFYPSNDTTSCFSESSILLDAKIFLYGNPFCTNQIHKTKLLRFVCRTNATSLVEVEELTIVNKSNKILQIIIACVSGVAVVFFIMGFFVIQKMKRKISLLREIQSEFDKRDVKPNLYSYNELKVATQDFHIRNELGRGGFGIVYKGIHGTGIFLLWPSFYQA